MPPKTVLLIEDDPEFERLIREVLARSSSSFELATAASLAAGVAVIEKNPPDLVLIDLNLPDSSGYETFLRVRECGRGIPIIVMTGLDDDRTAVQAVQDGAQDYLVKSLLQPKLLARRMSMAVSRHALQAPGATALSAPLGRVLAFIGSKGGVGTSTTAINVAALLSQNGLDTLAIELEVRRPGTLSTYLDTEHRLGLESLAEKPPETVTPTELKRCCPAVVSGLRLLCRRPASAKTGTLTAENVRAILCAARRDYRVVVLDLPPTIDEGILQAVELSDSLTLVVDREYTSIQCGAALMRQLKMDAAFQIQDLNVVIIDRTATDTFLALTDVTAQLKANPLAIIPASAAAIAFSQSARTPLVLLYPDDPFSLVHFELAERLLSTFRADFQDAARPLQPLLRRRAIAPAIPEITYG